MKKITLILMLFITAGTTFSQSTGCVSGDCGNGYGKWVWDNGDQYTGYWKENKENGQGTYIFKTGSKYVGEFSNGFRNGTGTYTWADGEKYSGEWKEDKQNGEGTHYYTNGTTQTGIWKDGIYQGKSNEVTGCISGDCDNGFGTYVWTGGEKYAGNWKNLKRNGQGTNYFATGEKYIGEWKDDLRSGYGTNYYNDNTTKEGMWEDDKYVGTGSNNYGCISGDCNNGYGIYTWNTGERYEGYFQNGMRNGQGTNIFPSGSKYEGLWKDDKKDGYGFYQYKPESEYESYRGDYVQDVMTGSGTFIYRNGQKYIGDLKNNLFDGNGTMYYADGRIEAGKWSLDKYIGSSEVSSGCVSGDCNNGFGTYISKSGDKYTGNFKNGKYSGAGTYVFTAGDTYNGDFVNGTYEGQGTYTFANGNKYVGEFSAGTYNGIGTLYYANGTTKSGKFVNGEYQDVVINKTPPQITWLTPEYTTTEATTENIDVKLCVKSSVDLDNVQIYVNNELKINNATRGFSVVNSNCDFTIEKNVPLNEGKNEIVVKITNTAGTTTSDTRIVNRKSAVVQSDQKRFALVIGNGAYPTAPLKNPPNDAKAMAAELRLLGFEVMEYTDLSQADMIKDIRAFGNKLSVEKGTGLFFYAGHGIQLNGENYIVPVSAVIEKEQDVEFEAVNIKRVLGEMDYAQNDLNIIILDACRNNPFARSFRSGGGNGLATTTAPKGTFIAYATAPGSVASDGTGNNGLYTQELIQCMQKPGVKIEDMFKQVRNNVYEKSNKQQVPWENSSIFGDFYFKQ
jgi:hypothetical protein